MEVKMIGIERHLTTIIPLLTVSWDFLIYLIFGRVAELFQVEKWVTKYENLRTAVLYYD